MKKYLLYIGQGAIMIFYALTVFWFYVGEVICTFPTTCLIQEAPDLSTFLIFGLPAVLSFLLHRSLSRKSLLYNAILFLVITIVVVIIADIFYSSTAIYG